MVQQPVSPQLDAYTLSADGAAVRCASDWLEAACQQHNVPQPVAERLVLCLNEVLANIINHGGNSARASLIGLSLEVTQDEDGNKVSVTASDAGVPFNPLSVPLRVLPKTLDDAAEGGLGLVMIRRCADWLDYHHADGHNRFTFGARWNS